MRSRIINFVTRHALFTAGFAALYTLYQKTKGEKRTREKEFVSTAGESDCNNGINWRRDKIIIDEAFRAAGWQKPIYVAYCQEKTGVFTANNDDGMQSAYVEISNQDFHYSDKRDFRLYAAMGHESIHAIHNDSDKMDFARGLMLYPALYFGFHAAKKGNLHKLWLAPIALLPESTIGIFALCVMGIPQTYLGMTLYMVSYMLSKTMLTATLPLARYQEIRADKESATVLGIATVLADTIEELATQKNITSDFFDEHPAPAKRVAYLKKLVPESAYTPTFFNSETYLNLGKPDMAPCPCQDSADEVNDDGMYIAAFGSKQANA